MTLAEGRPPPGLGQSGGTGPAAGVAPWEKARVPLHRGREGKTPSMVRNPSKPLQLRRTGDENVDPPGRYGPARCGNPNSTGRSFLGWGVWSQSHPERIGPHPRIINHSIHLQLRETGDENDVPPGRHRLAWYRNPNLRFTEPAPPGENRAHPWT